MSYLYTRFNKKWFTLLELLISITIFSFVLLISISLIEPLWNLYLASKSNQSLISHTTKFDQFLLKGNYSYASFTLWELSDFVSNSKTTGFDFDDQLRSDLYTILNNEWVYAPSFHSCIDLVPKLHIDGTPTNWWETSKLSFSEQNIAKSMNLSTCPAKNSEVVILWVDRKKSIFHALLRENSSVAVINWVLDSTKTNNNILVTTSFSISPNGYVFIHPNISGSIWNWWNVTDISLSWHNKCDKNNPTKGDCLFFDFLSFPSSEQYISYHAVSLLYSPLRARPLASAHFHHSLSMSLPQK